MAPVVIRPKPSSFAKACPQQVQLDVLQPCEPLPDSPFLQKLYRAGHEYEDETLGGLFDDVEGAVVLDVDDADDREWLTKEAVEEGARLIAGGRLPVDYDAHRVGEPDLLVRCGDGYLPVDVKSHKSLEAVRRDGAGTALVSEVSSPYFEAAVVDVAFVPRRHVGDQMQLAHYRRLLEAAGWAPSAAGSNLGGVCGTEGVVVWYDLDAPCLDAPEYVAPSGADGVGADGTAADGARGGPGPLSAMERYDQEFALRLEVSVAAEAHVSDASVALLAEPIVCTQCDQCRWREWCGDQLESVADLSLLSGVGVERRRRYKAAGIEDLHGLAALDWTTAELFRSKVDLDGVLLAAADKAPGVALAELIRKRPKQLETLAAYGLHSVGDLSRIDVRTLDVCNEADANAAVHIELARARVGPAPAYRRRGIEHLDVPRGDVEIDVDMESTNDGCYLWGALVTDRRGGAGGGATAGGVGVDALYVSFASWDPDVEAGELEAFEAFWSWFSGERAQAQAEGATFRAYCYTTAENRQMIRLADRLGRRDAVDELLGSEDWVDLYEVTKGQLVTGRGMGLKETAPLAGFAWRFDDAGGTLAMVKYDEAVDEGAAVAGRELAQQWILDYNEDDVRATAALRAWLDGAAGALPSIATWGEEQRSAA